MLNVEVPPSTKTCPMAVKSSDTIAAVKARISEAAEIPPERFELTALDIPHSKRVASEFGAELLDSESTISDYNIQDQARIHCVLLEAADKDRSV